MADGPRLTWHVRTRWLSRADWPWPIRSPWTAWHDGEPVAVPFEHADELRYHEPSATLFVRVDDVVRTVLDAGLCPGLVADATADEPAEVVAGG